MFKAATKNKANKSGNPALFQNNEKARQTFFQPKLDVGTPGDQYEVEADKIADQVIDHSPVTEQPFFTPSVSPTVNSGQPVPVQQKPVADSITPLLQRQDEEEEMMQMQPEEEEERIQAKADNAPAIPAGFESGLNGSKGSGSPLPSGVKSRMETGFATDFSNVRVHTDSGAAQMSRQIGAQAFTHGSDIYFNEGKFNPASQSGQHLIAHELTHTIQQGASVQPKMVQRQEEEEVAEIDPPQGVTPISDAGGEFSFSEGNYTTAFESSPANELRLPVVSVSDFKSRNSGLFNPPFQVPVGRDTNQVANWETAINDPATRHLNNKIGEATASGGITC
jgi:hypothetical protein